MSPTTCPLNRGKTILYWLGFIRSALFGMPVRVITFRRTPHPAAFKSKGIRIVSLWSKGLDGLAEQEEIWTALSLLDQHEPIHTRRVIKYIRTIFLAPFVGGGAYIQVGKICLINLAQLPVNCSARERIIAIAALLVHEATHGVFLHRGISCLGRNRHRIERICDLKQTDVLNRLA